MTQVSPPIDGQYDIPPEAPKWPKVLGIVHIVLGGLFCTCGACGVINGMRGAQAQEGMTPPPQPPPIALVLQGVGFLLAVLLLIAGIMLVMRKEGAKILHLVYAVLGIVTGFVGFYVNWSMIGAMQKWIGENPKLQSMSGFIMMFIYLAFTMGAIMLAYDFFLLVWFGIVKRKAPLGGVSSTEIV
jgi:hypothetical protein